MTDNIQQEGQDIDVLALLASLWRNIVIIILVAALGGAAAFGYTLFLVEPSYSATTTLYVNKNAFSLGDSNFTFTTNLSTTSLVNIYMLIIQSRTTLEEVIEEADLDMSSAKLGKMIEATQLTDGAFSITVTSSDPAQAELIANTVAKILPDRIADIIDGSAVRIIDYAIIPSTRSSPNYIKAALIGIAAGAVICSVVILIVEMLSSNNNTAIGSSDELRALFPDIPVLASIPDMHNKSKKGDYYSSYYGSSDGKGGK
ncbi:MAG: Wzz/FepE/Etk N-terminal domain-containing protein [Eubacteriales bacterium]|nr:Wzz/FepE/Etk N-terminal domain-containing protein [Eubacteriales bacterium]